MPISVPKHIAHLRNYQPGKTVEQILEEYGLEHYAVLWNNENPLGPSPKALEAVQKTMHSANLYPDPLGSDLRAKLAERLDRTPAEIALGNGGEAVLMHMLTAFCGPEDEVLTSEGTFVIIYIWRQIRNIACRQVPLTPEYGFDLEGILRAINQRTKIIYLANANNPTGAGIHEEELRAFLDRVPDHILVMVDEAYFEFSRGIDPNFPDSTRMGYPNVLTLRSFSKAYGIAAARLGYAVGPVELIEPLMKVKLTFEPGTLAQAAGMGALDDYDFLARTQKNTVRGLGYLYSELDLLDVRYVPSYANFVMIDLESAEKATRTFEGLRERGVFVRTLPPPLSHCLRVSVGTPEENELFIEKMRELFPVENVRYEM